jgi:hypothetical protein
MNNMKIRAGSRLSFSVDQADSTSVSATFIAEDSVGNMITDTVAYTDGVASFQFDSPDTDVVGVYDYQINENFATGSPDIYPNVDGCDDDCDLPTLEICESLGIGSS